MVLSGRTAMAGRVAQMADNKEGAKSWDCDDASMPQTFRLSKDVLRAYGRDNWGDGSDVLWL